MLSRWLAFCAVLVLCGCTSRVEHARNASASVATRPDAININIASVEELERLPYIGRTSAEAIVTFRTENGPFQRPEHLLLIKGISEKRFLDIREFLRTE
ncbi:MAG: ComEA family DNA-binding protein [Pyrinomonadaceae bacterium]